MSFLHYICDEIVDTDVKHVKVNSVQEACIKCFAVHILKFEILQTTLTKQKKHQNARFIGEKLKFF